MNTPASQAEPVAVPLPVKKILVPIDFSECSQFALRYAVNLAKQVDGSLILVHVASSLIAPPEMQYVHVDLKQFQGEIEKHASSKLTALAQKEIPATIPTSPIVRHGTPWEEITRVAKDRKADLIIIGTHGYSALKHMFLGSTAEKVVRSAGCPVLVVREYGNQVDTLQIRIHGDSTKPTLIYLPGLHGDWTLVSSFRAAIKAYVRFVEFTYPRTISWSLADHADAIMSELRKHNIHDGWILAESFGSVLAWATIEKGFAARGIVLAGGFVRYPFMPLVQFAHCINRTMPNWAFAGFCRFYAAYARFRHRHAPETAEAIAEFLRRRTQTGDREALCYRYTLIQQSDARKLACSLNAPIYQLIGFFDPIVPWWAVRKSLLRGCRSYRDWKLIWRADHNVLGTAPHVAADQVIKWMNDGARERT